MKGVSEKTNKQAHNNKTTENPAMFFWSKLWYSVV